MLAKKYRLCRKEINRVYKKGKSRNFGLTGLKFIENRENILRFAIVVPASVVKKANLRNRLRRIIYDQIGKRQEIKSKSVGKDIVIRLYRPPESELILRQKIEEILKNV